MSYLTSRYYTRPPHPLQLVIPFVYLNDELIRQARRHALSSLRTRRTRSNRATALFQEINTLAWEFRDSERFRKLETVKHVASTRFFIIKLVPLLYTNLVHLNEYLEF